MHNIQIKTKVYTNRILEEIRELTGKSMDAVVVADAVRKVLSDDEELEAHAAIWWGDHGTNAVCAFTPEQLLELAPHGFNPCPVERFVSGEVDLETAVGLCFEQTFQEAWAGDSWETGEGAEKFDFDLFQVTYGDRKVDQWLATAKDGTPLCDLCPECLGKESGKESGKDLKVIKN